MSNTEKKCDINISFFKTKSASTEESLAITVIVADKDAKYQMQYANYLGVYSIALLFLTLFISRGIGHVFWFSKQSLINL